MGTFPQLVNYLPNRFYLSSYNAPPPKNPKLQACVEDYPADALVAQRSQIDNAVADLATVDFGDLPQKLAKALASVPKDTSEVFVQLDAVNAEKAAWQDNRSLCRQ